MIHLSFCKDDLNREQFMVNTVSFCFLGVYLNVEITVFLFLLCKLTHFQQAGK